MRNVLLDLKWVILFLIFSAMPGFIDCVQAGKEKSGLQLVPQIGHTQEVQDILYASSGDFILTGAKDNKLKVWSKDGRLLRTIGVGGNLSHAALSPDGQLIGITKLNGYVEIWSPLGKRVRKLPRMKAMLPDQVAFFPDGQSLVACSRSSTPDYCQAYGVNGEVLAQYPNPAAGKGSIVGIGFSPDGSKLYLGSYQSVYTYSREGKLLSSFKAVEGFFGAMAVSPDGTIIATTRAFNSAKMDMQLGKTPLVTRLSRPDGTLVREFSSHSSRSLVFSRDGKKLLSGGVHDRRLLVHDIAGGTTQTIRIGRHRNDSPAHIAISPDGRQIVTADRNFKPVKMALWRLDGSLIRKVNVSTAGVINLDLDPSGKLIITTSADNQVRYWSLDGRLLRRHSANTDYPDQLAVDPMGHFFVTGNTELTLWNGAGKAVSKVQAHKRGARATVITPDGDYLLTGGIDGMVNMIPLRKGLPSKRFKAHDGKAVTAIAVHPKGKLFATGSAWERFRIWDRDGKLVTSFEMPKGTKPPFSTLQAMAFTPDGKYLVTSTTRRGQEIRFFNLKGKLVHSIKTPNLDQSGSLAISPNGAMLAVSVNQQIGVWDVNTRKLVRALNGHTGGIRALKFTADAKHLVSAGSDGTLRLWYLKTGRSYAMASEGDQWVVYSDDGYFDASRYGGDLVAMVEGLKGYAVDQFALYYNRPDELYRRVGVGGERVINHFKSYFERRMADTRLRDHRMMGTLHAPEIEIVDYRQQGKNAELIIHATDDQVPLTHLQLYVNDVPTFSGAGRKLSGQDVRVTVPVVLSGGKNRIEVSVFNAAGVESLRAPLYLNYTQPVKGDLYFVGLGVSTYADSALNLSFAHKDVADMNALVKRYKGHFNAVHTLPLVDGKATRSALERVRSFLGKATVDDTVILLVAGHGGYDLGDSATYYFLSHEADVEDLAGSAIPYKELEGLLGGIKPRKKLLLLDTCESGEIEPATLKEIEALAADKGLSSRTRKRLAKKRLSQPRPFLYQRDRYIYNNLARRSGAIVFSASLANESSLEQESLQNGVFTHSLMLVLGTAAADRDKDGYLSISELETAVKALVVKATFNLQHPSIERENIYQDFKLPLLR